MVQTETGMVAAKNLKPGDVVSSVVINELDPSVVTPAEFTLGTSLTLGSEKTTTTIVAVEQHNNNSIVMYFNGDKEIKYSNRHPMFAKVDGEYRVVFTENLKLGDSLIKVTEDGAKEEMVITSITSLLVPDTVYEFTCAPYKWFITGDILVHNIKI
jgi:hypothetical protein